MSSLFFVGRQQGTRIIDFKMGYPHITRIKASTLNPNPSTLNPQSKNQNLEP
jgi:hypothetical protein